MQPTKTSNLEVPGATLYYEVRGEGPVLLLICGGVYDAAGYAGLAAQLQDRYTVVTYDRRGNSRSPLAGPPEPQRIDVHADDAYRVLTAVGVTPQSPADVFGNSSGAMIALELAARHPELVRTVVAHEPPSFDLLPDAEHWRALMAEVAAAFEKDGPGAAGQVLGAGLRMRGGEPEEERAPGGGPRQVDPEMAEAMARMERNYVFFVGYEVPPFARYVPDLDALRAGSTRVVSAAGVQSAGEPPHRAALAVAERLGTEAVLFPGDHGGFGAHAEEFARQLADVLAK